MTLNSCKLPVTVPWQIICVPLSQCHWGPSHWFCVPPLGWGWLAQHLKLVCFDWLDSWCDEMQEAAIRETTLQAMNQCFPDLIPSFASTVALLSLSSPSMASGHTVSVICRHWKHEKPFCKMLAWHNPIHLLSGSSSLPSPLHSVLFWCHVQPPHQNTTLICCLWPWDARK